MAQRIRFAASIIGFLWVAIVPTAAQTVRIQALVDQTTVGIEEAVTFTLEIQGAEFSEVETPDPPDAEGLTLVQTIPSTRRNISIINGRLNQTLALEWTFRPVSEGRARINPVSVSVGGKTYRTEAITLTVVPQSQRPRRGSGSTAWPFSNPSAGASPGGDTASGISEGDLFIRAIPSSNHAYQNAQVTVDYRLYFRQGIQLRQSRLADSWDAEGFWREDLDVDARPIPQTVVENGMRYNTILLKRVAFFPTRPGELVIDPLKIQTEAYVPYRSSDPFSSLFPSPGQFRDIELSSSAVKIQVQPLPDAAPASFNGAVGALTLRSDVNETEVEAGESIEMIIEISGTGNIATLESPRMQTPGVFEVYDPQIKLQIDRSGTRIAGTKRFSYVVVPRTNGTFELPAVEFTHFDPSAQRYVTLRSEPKNIRVTGVDQPSSITATTSGLPVDDIAGIMEGEVAWIQSGTDPLYRKPFIFLLLLLPVAASSGVYFYRRRVTRLDTDREYARKRIANPVARKHLRRAGQLLKENQARSFYEELERAVVGYIGNRLNIAESGLTRQQLDSQLQETGVPGQVRIELQKFLEGCDRARFAPILPETSTMEKDLHVAGYLITVLHEHLDRTLNMEVGPN